MENRPQYRFLCIREVYRNLALSEREDEEHDDNIINTGLKEDIWVGRK